VFLVGLHGSGLLAALQRSSLRRSCCFQGLARPEADSPRSPRPSCDDCCVPPRPRGAWRKAAAPLIPCGVTHGDTVGQVRAVGRERRRARATAAARSARRGPWRRPDGRPPRSCTSVRQPRRAGGAGCAAGARRGWRAPSACEYMGGRSSQALSRVPAPRAPRADLRLRPLKAPAAAGGPGRRARLESGAC